MSVHSVVVVIHELTDVLYVIQIYEMLCWAAEADEEKSPGLTKFTEHFNNVSQWYVLCNCSNASLLLVVSLLPPVVAV